MAEKYEVVDSIESLQNTITRVRKAQEEFSKFSQEKVDQIFKAAAIAANQARIPLAQMAVEETGMGVVEDKIIKIIMLLNIFITNTKMKKQLELLKKITIMA